MSLTHIIGFDFTRRREPYCLPRNLLSECEHDRAHLVLILIIGFSGNAIFSEELNTCVIDNTDDGFDIHQLDSGTFVRSLKCPPSKRSFPRQVAFGENGNVVICGSNDGSAYVFDRRGGELVASLSHSASGRCQTVTV